MTPRFSLTRTCARNLVMAAALACALVIAAGVPVALAAFPGPDDPIAFTSDRDAGAGDIYAIVPGGAATRVTTSTSSSNPAHSPDGKKIAYVGANNQIAVMNFDGTASTPITSSATSKQHPAWSPDGRIAYAANSFDVDGQTDLEIWVVNADGSGRVQLTNNTYPDTEPAWSPDGTRIAFVGTRPGDTDRNIYVMNADGTGEANLTPGESTPCAGLCYQGHDDSPAWFPDGTRIAYTHTYAENGGGVPNIWTMNPDGSGKANLTDNPDVAFTQPAPSPQGTRLAAIGAVTTDRNLWVMNADGSGQAAIETASSHEKDPDWGVAAPPPPADIDPPETTITKGAPKTTENSKVKFKFSADEAGTSFECKLKGKDLKRAVKQFGPCNSPTKYKKLDPGKYKFFVVAVDAANNADPTPAKDRFKVVG